MYIYIYHEAGNQRVMKYTVPTTLLLARPVFVRNMAE